MDERIARLLPLMTAIHLGRVHGDARSMSKFWAPNGGAAQIRVTAAVDELFALRLASKGPVVPGGDRYLVLLTDEGRAVLAREGSSS